MQMTPFPWCGLWRLLRSWLSAFAQRLSPETRVLMALHGHKGMARHSIIIIFPTELNLSRSHRPHPPLQQACDRE